MNKKYCRFYALERETDGAFWVLQMETERTECREMKKALAADAILPRRRKEVEQKAERCFKLIYIKR